MRSREPAVSVVIPTYNRLGLLEHAVASVLNQTFGDLELIVVDDGSSDGTLDYLASVSDSRLQVIALQHSGNIAALRNAGVAHARARLIGFLDSDDVWLPEKLQIQTAHMAESGVRWSYTRYEHIDLGGLPLPARAGYWRELSGNIAQEMIAADASVTVCAVLVERELIEQVGGFDEDPRMRREDYDFTVRLSLAARTQAIPDSLVLVRDHAGRSTRAWVGPAPFLATAFAYEKLLTIVREEPLRRTVRRRRAYHLAEAGSRFLRQRSVASAAQCFWQSAIDQPNPRQLLSALLRGVRPIASTS